MCGICGTISLDSEPADPQRVREMLALLVHRGPDSLGSFAAARVCAGVRRLRVIDLATGDQPIASEDGSIRVVFNGEIYNYRELRRELERRGHALRTRSDTEVLVHLWEDEGVEMLARLEGMFTLCLHDLPRDEVVVARDPVGIKPLFLRRDGDRIEFASEIRPLRRGRGAPAAVDDTALVEAFCLQYVSGDRTWYRGVTKLLPGHLLRVRGGHAEIRRWQAPPRAPADPTIDERRVREELPGLLDTAVRSQTVSDVPLGMFLSGGIDSSVLLSLLSRAGPHPVETFSVGFEGEAGNADLRFARLAAERFGARHHELRVGAGDVERELPRLVDHLAGPVLDPALVPTLLLSAFARRDVTVVLTGEGADEIFGGYRRYLYASRLRALRRIPGLRRAARARGLRRLLPARAPQALDALGERDAARSHFLWSSTLDALAARALFEPDALREAERAAVATFRGHLDEGAASPLELDRLEWLPHDLLAKVDSASMAHSLEARVPFLDSRVIAWAAALPPRLKIRGAVTKVALREAFAADLPAEILARPKRGFDLPLASWIRGPLRPMVSDLLGASPGRWPALRIREARAMLDRYLRGEGALGLPLFLIASILLFLERGAEP